MGEEFWAAAGGAVVGAVIGGLISLGLQIIAQNAQETEREAERLERQRSLAYSLLYKLLVISSMFKTVSHHLEHRFAKVSDELEPWQAVTAYATPHQHVHFSAEELTMVMRADKDLFNTIVTLDERHNSLADTLVLYKSQREGIVERLSPTGFAGNVISGEVETVTYNRTRPLMIEANGVIQGARKIAARDSEIVWKAVEEVVERLNAALGMKMKVEKKADEEWLDSHSMTE